VCYSVLQCVAVCCSVLQCVAVCCSVLQCVAMCCSVSVWLQCVAVCCSVLQCVAMCCDVLRCVAVWYSVLHYVAPTNVMTNVMCSLNRRMWCVVYWLMCSLLTQTSWQTWCWHKCDDKRDDEQSMHTNAMTNVMCSVNRLMWCLIYCLTCSLLTPTSWQTWWCAVYGHQYVFTNVKFNWHKYSLCTTLTADIRQKAFSHVFWDCSRDSVNTYWCPGVCSHDCRHSAVIRMTNVCSHDCRRMSAVIHADECLQSFMQTNVCSHSCRRMSAVIHADECLQSFIQTNVCRRCAVIRMTNVEWRILSFEWRMSADMSADIDEWDVNCSLKKHGWMLFDECLQSM